MNRKPRKANKSRVVMISVVVGPASWCQKCKTALFRYDDSCKSEAELDDRSVWIWLNDSMAKHLIYCKPESGVEIEPFALTLDGRQSAVNSVDVRNEDQMRIDERGRLEANGQLISISADLYESFDHNN